MKSPSMHDQSRKRIRIKEIKTNRILSDSLKNADDKRNKEYLDQLYFALGGIYLKQDNKQEALADYLKSAHCSVSKQNRKKILHNTC